MYWYSLNLVNRFARSKLQAFAAKKPYSQSDIEMLARHHEYT